MKDVVAELRVGVKDLGAEDRDGWAPPGLSGRVRDLVGLSEALRVEVVRAVAAWDRIDAWAEDGAVTAPAWLRAHTDLTRTEAASVVHLARLYRTHPAVAAALDDGSILLAHARHLRRAERGRETAFAGCVQGLVDTAQENPVDEFAQVIDAWIELIDDGDPGEGTTRRFRLNDTIGGNATGDLFGPADEAAVIRAALDTPDPVDAPDGPRSREQRHGDLIVDICRRVLRDELGDDPSAPGGVDIIADAATAAEATADPEQLLAELSPFVDLLAPYTDHAEGLRLLRQRRCHRPDGGRATRATLAALLCSGWVRRIVTDPVTGQPIDVGRTHRRFTPRQRRALVIRDGGCVFPGCDRPARWCDAHHLRPWEDGGATDLDNGALLCRRHHVLVHNKGWTLQRHPRTGTITATGPDGRTHTRHPTDRCRP